MQEALQLLLMCAMKFVATGCREALTNVTMETWKMGMDVTARATLNTGGSATQSKTSFLQSATK